MWSSKDTAPVLIMLATRTPGIAVHFIEKLEFLMTCVTHRMNQTGAFGGPVLTCRLYVHIFQSGRYVSGYILQEQLIS